MVEDDRLPQPPTPRLRDYVLEDYAPAAPLEGRLHNASLFRAWLRDQGWLDRVWPMVEALQAALGPDETVWGIKARREGPPSLELYWYNHCRNAPGSPKSVRRIAARLGSHIEIQATADERLPYLMCSLELDAAALSAGVAPPFRVYLAGRRSAEGYDGVSMRLDAGRLCFEGSYWFYPQPAERALLRDRVRGAWRLGDASQRRWLSQPALLDCHSVCYAMKAETDALYFSRVPTAALLGPLSELWPAQAARLGAEAARFDHQRWDLGVDLGCPSGALGQATVQKVGLYGVF